MSARATVDWRHLRAVVLESDDWGLCAWVPDDEAQRALADTPAFRSPSGRIYGRSTLERADDVTRLLATLAEFRGMDERPPVWQANTVMATPDYARLVPPGFSADPLPLLRYPEFPARWTRPGLWESVERGRDAGLWWPEFHGLVHLPQAAWLASLRAGADDALRAHRHECFVCEAVEAAAEYDPREPEALRSRALAQGLEWFRERFGRPPGSLCAPDYRWDERLEAEAESLGVATLQGGAEQMGRPFRRARHALARLRWRRRRGQRFYLPARIAFEPRGDAASGSRLGARAAHRAVRAAWSRGQPAVVSSHRLNYAHLDAAWSEAGRAALRDLLARLAADGARFLTDVEVRSLEERAWSLRLLGGGRALLRHHGVAGTRIRIPVAPGVQRAILKATRGGGERPLEVESGEAVAAPDPGDYLVEWGNG